MEQLLLYRECIDFLVGNFERCSVLVVKQFLILKWTLGALLLSLLLSACGGFEAANHPDAAFTDGQGISSSEGFNQYVNSQAQDPKFRKARVNTQSSSLKLKTVANSASPSPQDGPKSLRKGATVDVFWPDRYR